jgi:hypothetical protein
MPPPSTQDPVVVVDVVAAWAGGAVTPNVTRVNVRIAPSTRELGEAVDNLGTSGLLW